MHNKSESTKHISPHRQRRRAFTLTEIAIVLGIVGLILGAIWAAASAVYANLKVSQAQQGIVFAAQQTRALFAGSNQTGATASPQNITSPGMFPTSWAGTAVGNVGNPWNQNTGNWSYVMGDKTNLSSFAVELDNISADGCSALMGFFNANASTASTAGAGQVAGLVGNKAVVATQASGTPGVITAALPAAWAAANFSLPSVCTGTGNTNSIAIEFSMTNM
jgi:type II secretory pathway pseudopilin PulG